MNSGPLVTGTGVVSIVLLLDHKRALTSIWLAYTGATWAALAVLTAVGLVRDRRRCYASRAPSAASPWLAWPAVVGFVLGLGLCSPNLARIHPPLGTDHARFDATAPKTAPRPPPTTAGPPHLRASELTIVLTTYDMDEAERLADRRGPDLGDVLAHPLNANPYQPPMR